MDKKIILEKEKIIKYFKSKKFGSTIIFKELQPLTHYNLQEEIDLFRFKASLMKRVKEDLMYEGINLKSIRNVGYYILQPHQIQSFAYRTYILSPLKKYEKARVILTNTKKQYLNEKQLKKHETTLQLDEELIEKTNSIVKDEKYNNLG